jgi:chromosomal replication initiation ATPase DnaA
MAETQIPLDFPVEAEFRAADLVITPANASAARFLDSWPAWPGHAAILTGPPGSGKSHMAHVWAARAGARFLPARGLTLDNVALIASGPLLLEDVAPGAVDETALFHCLNASRAAGVHCLLTSRLPPGDWAIATPDLASRLRAAHLAELGAPDDHLLSAVLVKLFADRQLQAPPDVVAYVVRRMERSLAAAQAVAQAIDRLSLARRQAPTRAIAAAALDELGMQ